MKTFSLCCIGFLAGSAAAFITQTPVLETLGYAPPAADVSTTAESTNLSEGDESKTASRVAVINDSNEATESSSDETAQVNEAQMLSDYSESADALPIPDEALVPDHYGIFSKGIFTTKSESPYQLPYRLLKPAKIVPGKRYPLTVFLHGAGERGSNNKSQLTYGSKEIVQWIAKSKIDSYVLFPQCPMQEQWADHNWYEVEHTAKSTPTQSMSALLGVIDEIRSNEPVDDQHIFAAGLSMGGFGVYDLIARRPGFFAAGAAFCGGSDCSPQFIEKLAPTRMYIVHGQADEIVSVQNSRNIAAALKQAGASPKYIELEGVGHNCWTNALSNDELFSWLYSGLKSTDADTKADVEVASRPTPKKITNKFARRPKQDTAAPTAKDIAGASSKAPSIPAKKEPVVKKQIVVAKPPMDEVKSEAKAKKTSAANAKVPAKETRSIAKSTPTPKAEAKKPESLSGQWQVTKAIHAGRVLSEKQTKAMAMEFVGEDIVIKHGKKRETAKFEIGEFESEGDSVFAELEIKSNRKNTPSIKGFFNKNGEVLTMVWGAPGAERPNPEDAEEIEAARTLTLKRSVN